MSFGSFTLQEQMGGVGWVRPFRLFQLLKNLRCLKTTAAVFFQFACYGAYPSTMCCQILFQIPHISTCTHTCVEQDNGRGGGNCDVRNTHHGEGIETSFWREFSLLACCHYTARFPERKTVVNKYVVVYDLLITHLYPIAFFAIISY